MKVRLGRRFLLILSILILLSTACSFSANSLPFLSQQQGPSGPDDAPEPSSAEETAIAEIEIATAVAGEQIEATPAASPTPLPTATAIIPTLRPSSTPLPTATFFVLPKPSPTPVCNYSTFVADVSIPDGSTVSAGKPFTKIWKLRNSGYCTWNTSYGVTYVKGDVFGGSNSTKLKAPVEPGQTVEIALTLTAPSKEGHYRSYFKMVNDKGEQFPGQFYVDINVSESGGVNDPGPYRPDPNMVVSFAEEYCEADWTNGTNDLPCRGTDGDSKGFVLYMEHPVLETGYLDNEPGLITNPPTGNNQTIMGIYPVYPVMPGDHFETIIGCERGAVNCNVHFQLAYYDPTTQQILSLGTWHQDYDEKYERIDLDLSPLMGRQVNFILIVTSNGESTNDRALWLNPRITRK
ncbi:MAG: hypothetical protein GX491_06775 [Chloroflexi bacterium]|nr:hypothetical protein [Chloroflexota bacterium]